MWKGWAEASGLAVNVQLASVPFDVFRSHFAHYQDWPVSAANYSGDTGGSKRRSRGLIAYARIGWASRPNSRAPSVVARKRSDGLVEGEEHSNHQRTLRPSSRGPTAARARRPSSRPRKARRMPLPAIAASVYMPEDELNGTAVASPAPATQQSWKIVS